MIVSTNNWETAKADYDILDKIGEGQDGIVYSIRRKNDGKVLAVKVGLSLKQAEANSQQEAFTKTGLAPEVYEFGRGYIIMELIDGMTFKRTVVNSKEIGFMIEMLHKYANFIDTMRSAGIVHGDPHGSNVMVLPDGTLKAIDFGAANKLSYEILPMKIFYAVLMNIAAENRPFFDQLMCDFTFAKMRYPNTAADLRKAVNYIEDQLSARAS